MKNRERTRREEGRESSGAVKHILIGALTQVILFFLLLALAAAAALKAEVDAEKYRYIGLALGAVAGIVGGFVCVRPSRKSGIPMGAAAGAAGALPTLMILFIADTENAGAGLFITAGIMTVFAALGGIAAVNIKRKTRI